MELFEIDESDYKLIKPFFERVYYDHSGFFKQIYSKNEIELSIDDINENIVIDSIQYDSFKFNRILLFLSYVYYDISNFVSDKIEIIITEVVSLINYLYDYLGDQDPQMSCVDFFINLRNESIKNQLLYLVHNTVTPNKDIVVRCLDGNVDIDGIKNKYIYDNFSVLNNFFIVPMMYIM